MSSIETSENNVYRRICFATDVRNVVLKTAMGIYKNTQIQTRVGVKYNWSSTQILQVLVIKYKYKYKYFAFLPIKYSSTSSTDTPSTSTSTSVNIGWLINTGNTRAVIPGKYRPVQ